MTEAENTCRFLVGIDDACRRLNCPGFVYVVSDTMGPLAGFTVKNELVTWLRRNQQPGVVLQVHRLVDGRDGTITHLDVNELISNAA